MFRLVMVLLIVGMILSACLNTDSGNNPPGTAIKMPGPTSVSVPMEKYNGIFYVSQTSGSDETGNGSKDNPWKSIDCALNTIKDAGESNRYAILVSAGEYAESTLQMIAYVDLFGGFKVEDWSRDINNYRTYLSGEGKRRVVLGASNARIDGFTIYRGTVLGQGGGIFCQGSSPTITNNIFWKNKTLKPAEWNPKFWHETANDGGAIYCSDGSEAVIQQNLFVENLTENGRGAGIACQKRCKPVIAENVFINNISGLDDPMRSSDGGAISIFDWCNARIENNIFLSNKALASNDAGGLFIALWSSAKVTGNIFVDNQATDDAGGLFVGGQEHRYDSPLDPIPSADKFFVSIAENIFMGNRNKSMNSGAMRFTMESRGEFNRNISAFNNGIYFQRSEVKVTENIILDDFLFIETKEGLKQGEITKNLIWADFKLEIGAKVNDNHIKGETGATGYSPKFEADGRQLIAESVIYQPKRFMTRILQTDIKMKPDQFINRIIRAGNHWGIIRSNDEDTITVWGDFSGLMVFNVLPTYTLTQ